MSASNVRKQLAGVLLGVVFLGAAVFAKVNDGSSRKRYIDDGSKLIGNWTGESICVGDNPACHDEKVVYRISKSPTESGQLVITMDKIVDGKPETMGVLNFKYDSEKGTLVGEFKNARYHGLWEFTVKGNMMEGTLSLLPARTIGRRVKVKKDE
jgi:hypothetical protein